jgi:hypothetical protein
MGDNKRKHLEFISNVITRKNANSFLIKGWTIALLSALLALATKSDSNNYFYICYFVILNFWVLDGVFVSLERRYRSLYRHVSSKVEESIDFDMDVTQVDNISDSWCNAIFSWTLILFYGLTTATIIFTHLIFN